MSRAGHLHLAAATTGAVLVLFTLIDFTASVWPLQPGEMRWRYAALSALSGSLMTPALGLLLLVAVAIDGERKRLQLALAGAVTLGALVLAAAPVILLLDAIQLRTDVVPGMMSRFDLGVGHSILKLGLGSLGAGVVAFATFRAWRSTRSRAPAKKRGDVSSKLVSPRPLSRPDQPAGSGSGR